jgi:predicted naringenin-chalcone synthase
MIEHLAWTILMSFAILGLGTAVPPTRVTQEAAAGIARSLCCRTAEQETWLPLMYQHTGIQSRHLAFDRQVVEDVLHGTTNSQSIFLPTGRDDDRGPTTAERMRVYFEEAGPLALRAARQALTQASLDAEAITHLVTVSCTGMKAPGVDYELIQGLGLAATVQRTHIGFMGCHGAINGLRVARAFADSEPEARVLLCATELCVLHYYYGWDPQKIIANALFADGAAAVVGASDRLATAAGTWSVTAAGSCLIPDSREAMSWTIGDHGFEMTLSKRVPNLIHEHLRPWLEKWLAHHGLSREAIGSWAIHPGGPRILDAIATALELSEDQLAASREVFAEYGNMSSPTVLFIVKHLRSRAAPLPCVGLAFGPGLIAESVLIE